MTRDGGSASMIRQVAVSLVLAVATVAAAWYYVANTGRLARLAASGVAHPLGSLPPGRVTAPAIGHLDALAANPLDQPAVNGVIVDRALASGDTARAMQEAALLRRLGWRSSAALQNLLWRGGMTNDLPLLIDTLDALLRREKLLAQIYPVLNLMTTDPGFRALLTGRLAGRPSWRRYYFMSASDLTRPGEIEGRYLVMRAIQRRGDRLARNEVAPILPKLLGIGSGAQAFELWRAHAGGVASPLADTDFRVAAKPLPAEALPVVFEWQLGSGSGFFTDAARDDRGTFASIDWNGRGTPVFASQVTSARAGRYRLEVAADEPGTALADRLGFRLACAGRPATEFVAVDPTAARRLRLATRGAVPCAFPRLELYGLVQPGGSSGPIVLRSIRLDRSDR